MKLLPLFLVLFGLASQAQSTDPAEEAYRPSSQEQCSEIDLRGEQCPDGSPRLPGLRSQGLTNYCFAYSATDLVSYATCRNLSALSSGIIMNITHQGPIKDPANPINLGGSPRVLLEILNAPNRGPCLEPDFPSSPPEIMPQSKTEGPTNERTLGYLMDFYNRRQTENPLRCTRQNINGVSFNEPLTSPERSTTNSEILQAIKTALETNRQPAGLHVKSDFVMTNEEMDPERPDLVGTDHYVSVVGRKWINGHCHYLYRDQNPMRGSPWPRAEDHPGQAASTQPSSDYFYIWVREENLLNNADDVIFNTN